MKHLSREERYDSILDAAWEILRDSGIDAVSINSIASRLRLTRQLVYTYFHTVDDVLDALVDRTFEEFFGEVQSAETTHYNDVNYVLARLELILILPVEVRRVIRSAFFATSDSHPAMLKLQVRIHGLIDANWTVPLVNAGADLGAATAGPRMIIGVALQLCELRDQGVISAEEAQRDLSLITSAVTNDPRRRSMLAGVRSAQLADLDDRSGDETKNDRS